MNKGQITLHRLNLMGFTPETQVFIVRSTGGPGYNEQVKFLQANRRHFDNTSDGYALRSPRIPRFTAYANAHGFEVVVA